MRPDIHSVPPNDLLPSEWVMGALILACVITFIVMVGSAAFGGGER